MTHLKPVRELADDIQEPIRALFTDLDDTLTDAGRVSAEAYRSLWALTEAGIDVVVVTGRPAGWCDAIARLWPVKAVIGENGALTYAYDAGERRMIRSTVAASDGDLEIRRRRPELEAAIRAAAPDSRVAADQPFRIFDLAIDFAEDVGPLDRDEVEAIRRTFVEHGARAKVSSIHVNGWFGTFDKIQTIRRFVADAWGWTGGIGRRAVYVGDSPNDEPAFAEFQLSVGVANVLDFELTAPPRYVTQSRGGKGFAELVRILVEGSAP